ncbi:MAG: DUF2079 domain-containing protein [Patescibacteria group bacterium]
MKNIFPKKFLDSWFVAFLAVSVFIFYATLSILKHLFLQTNAFDLGIFSQTLWKFSQGDFFAFNSVREKIALGDHLDLILIPLAILKIPFFFISSSMFLLIIQAFFLSIGGIAIYKFSRIFFAKNLSVFFQFLFYFLVGTQSAMLFDFHTLTLSASIFPWLIWSVFDSSQNSQTRKTNILVFTILILLCREDQGLILSAFFLSSSIFLKEKNLLLLLFFSTFFSIFAIFFVIPQIFGSGYIYDSMYKDGFIEVIEKILKPNEFLIEISNAKQKTEFILYFLIFGGIFLSLTPEFLPLFILLFAIKNLTNFESTWGLKFHYASIFSPFIILTFILGLSRISFFLNEIFLSTLKFFIQIFHKPIDFKNVKIFSKKVQNSLSIGFFAIFIFLSFNFRSPIFEETNKIFSEIFITKTIATESNFFRSADKIIPKSSSISTQSNLVPHFSERNKVFLFPDGIEIAEYIVLSNENGGSYVWPISPTEKDKLTRELIQNPNFKVLFIDDDFLILKRVKKT